MPAITYDVDNGQLLRIMFFVYSLWLQTSMSAALTMADAHTNVSIRFSLTSVPALMTCPSWDLMARTAPVSTDLH